MEKKEKRGNFHCTRGGRGGGQYQLFGKYTPLHKGSDIKSLKIGLCLLEAYSSYKRCSSSCIFYISEVRTGCPNLGHTTLTEIPLKRQPTWLSETDDWPVLWIGLENVGRIRGFVPPYNGQLETLTRDSSGIQFVTIYR